MDFQRWQSKTIMPGEGWHSDKQSGSGLLRTWFRRALAAPRARLEAGAGARAGQASQPPARAGQAWGARLEAGAGARAGQASQPPARAGQAWGARLEARLGRAPGGRGELPRAGQAWGARLEAGASSRARGRPASPPPARDRPGARAWRRGGRRAARGAGLPAPRPRGTGLGRAPGGWGELPRAGQAAGSAA